MHFRSAFFVVFAVLVLLLLPSVVRAAPPSNDNFAGAQVLTGQAVSSTPVRIDDATREGLEREETYDQTVWYRWKAPQDGIVTMTTAGTDYYDRLAVFNGTALSNLVLIDYTDGNFTASLSFFVKGGFTYQIAIGSRGTTHIGTAVLNINNKATTLTAATVVGTAAGGNDNFAKATTLSGANVSAFTYPVEATREGLEPAFSFENEHTVWWTWTAPADATVRIDTSGIDFYSALLVYNGSTLSNLEVVAYDEGNFTATVQFPTKAGVKYYISLGSRGSNIGNTSIINIATSALNITAPVVIESLANANDNYSNATDLGNHAVVSGFGFNAGASVESLEPTIDGNRTLWWKWTAPSNGTLSLDTTGSDVSTEVNAYAGDAIGSAVDVGSTFTATSTGASAPVKAGTTYHFALGSNSTGTFVLNLKFAPSASATTAVSVAATTPSVVLGSGAAGAFTINLSTPLAGDIKVAYVVKGSGINGVDYAFLKGTTKIKAGKTSKVIKVLPQGGLEGAGKKVVKLTLAAGAGYTISTPGAVKVKILAH